MLTLRRLPPPPGVDGTQSSLWRKRSGAVDLPASIKALFVDVAASVLQCQTLRTCFVVPAQALLAN